jgi:hypothetical protein
MPAGYFEESFITSGAVWVIKTASVVDFTDDAPSFVYVEVDGVHIFNLRMPPFGEQNYVWHGMAVGYSSVRVGTATGYAGTIALRLDGYLFDPS